MKRFLRKTMILVLTFLLLMSSLPVQAASQRSDGKNMEKVLQYYKKRNFSMAAKYSKKISKTTKEACVGKMSAKMKQAYRKIVRKWPLDHMYDLSEEYLWGYYLTDIDNDKKAELIVKVGTCEADVRLLIYKYKSGKAVRIGKAYAGHTSLHAYPDHKGVVIFWGHMGGESISLLTIKGNKAITKQIGERYPTAKYLNLRGQLYNHIKYDSSYHAKLDLRDLT